MGGWAIIGPGAIIDKSQLFTYTTNRIAAKRRGTGGIGGKQMVPRKRIDHRGIGMQRGLMMQAASLAI